MRIFILGDTHGDLEWTARQIRQAAALGADCVMQLGDFGVWDGEHGEAFLDGVSAAARAANLPVYFIDGNHENFDLLYSYELDETGTRKLRDFLWHMPRGSVHVIDGVRIGCAGGGVSVDRRQRTPGVSWWPQEAINDEELASCKRMGKLDVLLSHDCPSSMPMRHLKPDLDSAAHRMRMNEIGAATQPDFWLHGHMHFAAQYGHRNTDEHVSEVYSLGCNRQAYSCAVLDTNDCSVQFPV